MFIKQTLFIIAGCILINTQLVNAQVNTKFTFSFDDLKNNKNIRTNELEWLRDSVPPAERNNLLNMVNALSSPAAAQLLPANFYLDGSFNIGGASAYIDSLAVRPPDDTAGIIRVAYLCARLRKIFINDQAKNTDYITKFSGEQLRLPAYDVKKVNHNIHLSFDYEPANILLDILSTPDIKVEEIEKRINLHQFDMLYVHHAQSFYKFPLNKERLAICLEKAASTNAIDIIYRYINPYGLLNYTEVKSNLSEYKNLIHTLSVNENNIFNYINVTISPFLPDSAHFSRKVSFFMISNSDGWGAGDVTAIDLNYYKDDYSSLIPDFAHETFHSGQAAVHVSKKYQRPVNEQAFVDILDYIYREGTASFVTPPVVKTKQEYEAAAKKGCVLIEGVFQNTIIKFNPHKAQALSDEGIEMGGPFYWTGAEMSRVIVEVFGKERLAAIIPFGGITLFQTYFSALKHSKSHLIIFSPEFEKYITEMKI